MKKGYYLLLLTTLLFTIVSCDTNPLSKKQFYGEIIREKDSVILSPVVLDFNKDVLKVYSDAVFGKGRTDFKLTDRVENRFYYSNPQSDVMLCIDFSEENNSILVTSTIDNQFFINAVVDSDMSMQYIDDTYKNVETVYNPNNYLKNISCTGHLYRTSDNKKLSKMVLIEELDTIKVYSNTVFGAKNINLNKVGVCLDMDCFKYSSNNFQDIIIYSFEEGFKLEGDGFYAILTPSHNIDISFFNNRNVSSNVNNYPAVGSKYKGEFFKTRNTPVSVLFDMIIKTATVEFISENNIKITLVDELKKDLSLWDALSLPVGVVAHAGEKDIRKHKYYINAEGKIVIREKVPYEFKLSKDNKTLKFAEEPAGVAANLKLIN